MAFRIPNSEFRIQRSRPPDPCYHPSVIELKRFLAYIRPYLAQMIAAAIMMALAGALMSLVVATLNPLVNEVLLARQPATEDSGEAGEPSEAGARARAGPRRRAPERRRMSRP